ncbi:cupin domain-containing protein [Halalkalibacter krulwichiae]|uniref:Cupin domain protein n=1 Tax=Halalkalibacter krulwichiae TaxID=199441 RepID=A0A1X9MGT5_9BACI|nr:cupin domain-containing protein [Halalkalibacter krulwichiae]ARK32648.1 Cupin domain protein [Halalkalibacter krulwichiae]
MNYYHSYPFYANVHTPIYHSPNMTRDHGQNPQVVEAILTGVKREATALNLYQRLADAAPNEEHNADLLQSLEEKKTQVNEFRNLYSQLTGSEPNYQIDEVRFEDYEEGLYKAYELEIAGYEQDQRSHVLTEHPHVQNAFLQAMQSQHENAWRIYHLTEDNRNRQTDFGPNPFVIDIEEATKENDTFRTALWTGEHLQVTLMSIGVGEDIGLENHPHLDQFLRIEEGQGIVQMGDRQDQLDFQAEVFDDFAIIVPAGKWHNLTNTGDKPLKLYSIYAPPQHPFGTVHATKAEALEAEEHHHS